MSTPSIYPINHKKIVEGIFNQGNKNKSYSTIASFVYSNSECLNWFLNSKKVDQISEELLSKMHENISDQKLVKDCFEEIYLLSSLATYSPIKNHLIEEKVPLKILTKLQS